MRNRTYVCFECRTTERVSASRITRICRKCRKQAEHVYYKFKIPRRDDDAGWQELQSKVRTLNRQAKSNMLSRLGQERTKLQRLLAEVPESKQDRLRSLRFKLKSVNKKPEEWSMW
jgi:hypothetical protein